MTRRGGALTAALLAPVLVSAACSAPGAGDPASPTRSLTTAASSAVSTSQQPAAPRRPNVLVITADDMRADDLRWMPRTRRLLQHTGLRFLNSFSPNPLCCPARASFLTGRYSHNHRVLSHEAPYGFGAFDDSRTLATRLHRAGYRTALVGKYLNGYGEQPTYRGHHPSLHYVPPGWSQWWGSTDHRWARGEGPGGGTYNYTHLTSNVNGSIRTWPGRYTTDVTAGQTQALVRSFGRRAPSRPWFIWWTPVAPHFGGPREPDDPGTIRRSDGKPVDWVTPARPAWVRHRFDRAITHGAGTPPHHPAERNVADKPRYIRSYPRLTAREKRAERDVTRQRAEALFVLDRRVADTLATLRSTGQASRTIVVLTSDNGYYLGEHRKRQGKITLHEPSIRVPLLMAGPGIPHGARHDPATVEDLAVTIADWAGTTLPRADGASLRPTIGRGDSGWTRPVVLEGRMPEPAYRRGRHHHAVMRGLNTVGVRTGRYVLIRYSTGETEVYDLRRDPLELSSLRGPATRDLRRRLADVWDRYAACAGAECRRPLPADLQTTPQQTAAIARHQERVRHRYFRY
ncbi:MAG TPA: sulfatase-like hydrolase/transferase [Nocardioides sp.]|nr:sulfatase-like hydrolase/transferase [Nocardioides sp.]